LAGAGGRTEGAVTYLEQFLADPGAHHLFEVMRRIERGLGAPLPDAGPRPRIGDSATRRDERLRLTTGAFTTTARFSFGEEPWTAFPDATLGAVQFRFDASSEATALADFTQAPDRIHILSRFLGLLGPQGPLPYHLTEEAHGWTLNGDHAFAHFLDVFNNRFIQLFYRAWADSRAIAQADRPECDRFCAYVTSMIGVGSRAFDAARDNDAPQGAALYAGLLGAKAKSASRLRQALRGLLNIRVDIDEFVGSWLVVESDERSRLGAQHFRLGADFLLGAAAFSLQDKIRIRIFARDLSRYRLFLPNGSDCDTLVDLMFFHLGEEYDWDVELVLPAHCIAPFQLPQTSAAKAGTPKASCENGVQLGWTSWLTKPDLNAAGSRSDARFRPAERKRHERDMARRESGSRIA
jgi:type VI secretion system protein ImpH